MTFPNIPMQHSWFFSRPQALAAWLLAALLWAGGAENVAVAQEKSKISILWPYLENVGTREKPQLEEKAFDNAVLPIIGLDAHFPIWVKVPKVEPVNSVFPTLFIYGALRDANGQFAGNVEVVMGSITGKGGVPGKAEDQILPGKLSITGVVAGARPPFAGSLLDATRAPIAHFELTPQEPNLVVHFDGALPTAGPVMATLTAKAPSLQEMPVLTLTAAGGGKLKGVVVKVSPFTTEQGATAGVEWMLNEAAVKDGVASLSELEVADLRLKVKDLPIGTHRAKLIVLWNGATVLKNVTLERPQTPELLAVDSAQDLRATTEEEPRLTMTLRDTSGTGMSLTGVSITKLARVNKDGAGSQGDTTEPKPTLVDDANHERTTPLPLPSGNQMMNLTRKMKRQAAGEYDGVATLVTPGPQFKTATFKLYVREPESVAARWIAYGVALAGLARFVYVMLMPRLRLQRRVAALNEQLGALEKALPGNIGILEGEEVRMLDSLRAGLAVLNRDLDPERSAEAEAAITRFEQKLAVVMEWIPARRNKRGLSAGTPGFAEVEQTVKDMKAFLDDSQATEAAFTLLRPKMNKLNTDIETAHVAQLTAEREKLKTEIQKADLGIQERGPLLRDMEAVEPRAPGARRSLDLLQGRFADLLAGLLLKKLNEAEVPVGFEGDHQSQWEALKAEVRKTAATILTTSQQDSTKAMADYRLACSIYIEGLAERLIAVVGKLDPISMPGAAAIQTKLGEVRTKVDSGDLTGAGAVYAEAVTAYKALLASSSSGGALESMSAPPPGVESPVAGLVSTSVQLPPHVAHTAAAPPSVTWVTLKLFGLNALMMVVVGAIAVLVGINLLWVKDPVWGGTPSHLGALLWGLGLQTTATFTGFKALEDSLSKGK